MRVVWHFLSEYFCFGLLHRSGIEKSLKEDLKTCEGDHVCGEKITQNVSFVSYPIVGECVGVNARLVKVKTRMEIAGATTHLQTSQTYEIKLYFGGKQR
jgi:hypothetical protein